MSTAEALAKRKRIRGGHRSKIIHQVEEALGKELFLLKCSLKEKLETLRTEIVDIFVMIN